MPVIWACASQDRLELRAKISEILAWMFGEDTGPTRWPYQYITVKPHPDFDYDLRLVDITKHTNYVTRVERMSYEDRLMQDLIYIIKDDATFGNDVT